MKTFKEFVNEEKIGTYIGAKFDTQSRIKLLELIQNIPNGVEEKKLHSTIIYSRKKIFTTIYEDVNYQARPENIECWDTQDGKRAVILKLNCASLVDRHNDIMRTTDATYDFDQYMPHITLSYEVSPEFKIQESLIANIGTLILNHEYMEDLDLSWTN